MKESMEDHGWVGRPLVAIKSRDGKQLLALTGSNRIAAAHELRVEVPVIILNEAESKAARRTGLGQNRWGEYVANPFSMADELEDAGFKAMADLIHLDELFHDDPDLEDDPEGLLEHGIDPQVVELVS